MVLKTGSLMCATHLRGAGWREIPAFLERNAEHLTGRVLDWGCGDQRYRKYIAGTYCSYDPYVPGLDKLPEGLFNSILITQVLQTVVDPVKSIEELRRLLQPEGKFVVTYNANWYEVMPLNPQSPDRWRFSQDGMECLLGGRVLVHENLVDLKFADFILHMTYGIVVQA